MFLITTLLNRLRQRMAEKPAIKIRGTDGRVTKIYMDSVTTDQQLLAAVRRYADMIARGREARIINRPCSSIVVLDDDRYVTVWYGNHERD